MLEGTHGCTMARYLQAVGDGFQKLFVRQLDLLCNVQTMTRNLARKLKLKKTDKKH